MEINDKLLQQANHEVASKYPYISYILELIAGDSTKVIDVIPDNLIDYLIVDLEVGRITELNLLYNNAEYYELNIGFDVDELEVTIKYSFKITERFKDVISESMECVLGEPILVNYNLNTEPKLTLLKGGKE